MKKSRKAVKRMISFLLSAAMVFACAPVSADAAKKPKLNKTSATLRVGKKLTLKVKNTKTKATWSIKSGKKYITLKKKKKASVVVQAKKPGTAKVVAKIGKKKLVCKVKVKKSNATAVDNDPVEDDPTSAPAQTVVPTQIPTPGNSSQPGSPDPVKTPGQSTSDPEKTSTPGNPSDPEKTSTPGNPSGPGNTSEPENTQEPENPGQEVDLPSDATVFTMGTRKLAIGMTGTDVYTVLGTSSNQEIRTGKSPQGFDTIAYNTKDYSEYLLIYLKEDLVTGICGIGKNMEFSDAVARGNGNNLGSNWINLSDYKTNSGKTGAKKYVVSGSETAYTFYDALGSNGIYCIQVFNQNEITDADNDMIFGTTGNLTYNDTVNASIATEIGKMLNAFRAYYSVNCFYLNDSLAQCAQDYCDTITASKINPRDADDLLDILFEYGVDPMNWGEVCYYDAADAISFVNSLIEMDSLYPMLVGADASTWCYIGVGMASYGKHTYLAIDYVDEI